MDEDAFQEMFDSSVSLGLENAAILEMATAWCQNVGRTKGGVLGTGMIEAATGLPVTGGSLRCDHAQAPTTFGHSLADSAVDFYERNCVGCPHRKPTNATEHLGTWADGIIAERKHREQEALTARLAAEEARRLRRDERRLRFGAPEPTGQAILDLIDRVDGEDADDEAEQLLLRHAEMSPGDFTNDLLAHLTNEAVAIGRDILLETVIAVFERDGRPGTDRMLEIAFDAIRAGLAGPASGRVIAGHTQRFDPDARTLAAIMVLAAGTFDFSSPSEWAGAEPAALFRVYDLDPEPVAAFLGSRLRHEEGWMRSAAGHAVERLVAARPDAGPKLLPALLDALLLPDKSQYLGDPFPAGQAIQVVADILVRDPVTTAAVIDQRFAASEPRAQRTLWRCYDNTCRSRMHDPLPVEPANVIVKRAVSLLALDDLDVDLRRAIADSLSVLCRYHADAVTVPLAEIVALLVAAAERFEAFDESPPDASAMLDPEKALLTHLEWESGRIGLNAVVTELKESLEALAQRDPTAYVEALVGVWTNASASPRARASLLEILGEVVETQADLDACAQLLLETIELDRNQERAAALEALAAIGRHNVSLPTTFTESVIKALQDEYLIIVRAAITAIPRTHVPPEQKPAVVQRLLEFAASYGPQRAYAEDVLTALSSVRRLARGESYQVQADDLILGVVASLPAGEAVEILTRFSGLREHPSWPIAAVAALQPDPDPNWSGVHDRGRADLLRELAMVPAAHLAPVVDELERIGRERLPHDESWGWAVSDVLARQGEHARAGAMCDAVYAAMPDTTEYRPRRSLARQTALGHHVDAALIAGDAATAESLLVEWALLTAEEPSHE